MNVVSRRGFVASLGATVGAGCLPYVPVFANAAIEPDQVLHTAGDGIGLTPREYASLLTRLCQSKDVAEDNYLLGGEVEASSATGPLCSGRRRRCSCRPARWRTS
jgi:hypothetical protein